MKKISIMGIMVFAAVMLSFAVAQAQSNLDIPYTTQSSYSYDPNSSSNPPLRMYFGYNDLQSEDIRAELYSTSTPSTVIRTWQFTGMSGTGKQVIEWNCKDLSNQYVTSGTYTVKVYAPNNNDITPRYATFSVSTGQPGGTTTIIYVQSPSDKLTISNITITPNPYNSQMGNVQLRFNAYNPINAKIRIGIYDNNNELRKVWENFRPETGSNTIDLTTTLINLPSGNYTLKITGMDNDPRVETQQIGFSISVPPTVISNIEITNVNRGRPNTTYVVTNPGNARLDATIYDNNNRVVASRRNIDPVAGQNSLPWFGDYYLPNGTYTLEIKGASGYEYIQPQRKTFTVAAGTGTTTGGTTGTTTTQSTASDLCAGYPDIRANDPNCAAITWAKSKNLFTGNGDGTLAPLANLQRDQVIKVIAEGLGFSAGTNYCQGRVPFRDIGANNWAYQYACFLKDRGVITGYLGGLNRGKFLPEKTVSHAEFMAMILRAGGRDGNLGTASVGAPWYEGYANYASNKNLFTGAFRANAAIPRGEAIRVLYQLYNQNELGNFAR